jgi:hypothetical protein
MTNEEEAQQLVASLTKSFPVAAKATVALMKKRGYANLGFLWLEAFADVTNQLLKGSYSDPKNGREAQAHLASMGCKFAEGSAHIKSIIDTYYVENLMFQFSDKEKRAAWTLFPPNIKALYSAMWGEPR